MSKIIKNLSMNVVKSDNRFHRREDLDFRDDGNIFRGFDYKGMPITTLRTNGYTYCCIRVDYMDNQFAYMEWMTTEEYRLAEEFNGVREIDLDKFVDNCERVLAKVAELNENAEDETLDMSDVVKRLKKERSMVSDFIEEAKRSVKWWKLDPPDLKSLKWEFDWLVNDLDHINQMLGDLRDGELTSEQERYMYFFFKKYGYVRVKDLNEWSVDKIRKAM